MSRDDLKTLKARLFFVYALILLLLLILFKLVGATTLQDSKVTKWQKGIVLCNYHGLNETTGFFVSGDGLLVTTFHLIKGWHIFVDGYHIYIAVHKDKKPYKAEVISFNKTSDLLFLKIDYKPEVWFDEFENPKNGQKCIALGHPYGWTAGLEAKVIMHTRFDLLGIDRIPIAGSSGSVILSEEGKILGMLTKKYGLAIITHGVLIKNGLKRIEESKEE